MGTAVDPRWACGPWLRVVACALLPVGCAHLPPKAHAKAALVRPPAPYDPAAEAAGEDMAATARRGVVLVPTVTPTWVGSDAAFAQDPRALGAWVDGYRLAAKACADSYLIWTVETQMSPTERALGELAGALTRDDPRAFAVRFSCTAQALTPAAGVQVEASGAAAAPAKWPPAPP